MKKYTLMIFCISIWHTAGGQTFDAEWNDLLNTGDYLQMAKRYETARDSIENPTLQIITEAFLHSAFNQPEQSCEKIGELLNFHQESLGLNGITAMIQFLALNFFNLGNYQSGALLIQSYLDQTAAFDGLDEETRKSLERYLPLQLFGDGYAPVIIRPEQDCEVPITPIQPELASLISVPVILNGDTSLLLLDTGADGYATNTITEGFARRHGIRIYEDSILLSGVNEGYARLAMADSIQIGEITYKNVPFTISPGDFLAPVDSIFLEGVLGLAFLRAVGEIHMYPNENKVIFPYTPTINSAKNMNMMFQGGQPYVELYSGNERMLFHMDTGGGISLSGNYYEKHKQQIEATGKLKSDGGIAGFGGKLYFDIYILPEFPLTVSGITKTIEDIHVFTGDTYAPFVDGSVGSDFIRLFNKVIINFNNMTFHAE